MTPYPYKIEFKLLMVIVLLSLSKFAFSQNLKAQDSLTHYLMRSAQNNPALKASYNQYLTSLQMIQQVGSLPDPEMTFGVFLKPNQQLMGNQNADIKLMQMFPWFGTLTISKTEAAQMAKARFQEFLEARNRLFFDLTSIYYQIYRLEKEKALAEINLKYLTTYEKLSLIRFKTSSTGSSGIDNQSGPVSSSGATNMGSQGGMDIPQQQGVSNQIPSTGGMSPGGSAMPKGKGIVDVLGVQMEIKDQENTIAYLNDQTKPLVASFNAYLNRPLASPVFIPDTLTALKNDTTLKALTDSAISNNPMLKMYAAEQESYKAKMEKSRRMGLPMFGFGVDYMLLSRRADVMGPDNGMDMIMPMVNLTL
ncbi:MAG: hypothetical protein Q8908_16930, partial [Bacteroidota bacterium]|nr:hypothetical protein [Bacteroidota bacterium]